MACVPGIKFGLAFCEASGKCLVRWSGTDPAMVELAERARAEPCCRSLGVVDGHPPKGIEGDDDIAWRKSLLRPIGYKP